jgi:hypothetical protein
LCFPALNKPTPTTHHSFSCSNSHCSDLRSGKSVVGRPSESQGTSGEEDENAIVRRRLLYSAGITVGVVLLTLIPTELLDGSASKPLYQYLVPLLRSIVSFLRPPCETLTKLTTRH